MEPKVEPQVPAQVEPPYHVSYTAIASDVFMNTDMFLNKITFDKREWVAWTKHCSSFGEFLAMDYRHDPASELPESKKQFVYLRVFNV